jgi:peptidoglycan/LPS O-acetylase OafA/YrhL
MERVNLEEGNVFQLENDYTRTMTQADSTSSEVTSNRIQAIQGLRGIAVLLVVFCHLEIPFFKNGFIGVDVFFVISGFLITRIMVREYVSNRKASRRQGWISFVGFYSRRIRRIVPAAYFVIFAVLIFGTLIPNATNLRGALVSDVSWAAFFLSNLHYTEQATQYFGETTQQSPLLHYWSLAVEEQFYLLWPVLFLAVTSTQGFKIAGIIFNWRNRLRLAMVVLTLSSFSAYIFLSIQNSASSYYSSIGRFWEFSVGALFALGINIETNGTWRRVILVAMPVVLILLFSCFLFLTIDQMRMVIFVFVIVTALLLHASTVGKVPKLILKILESRFFVFFGKISFSLYLVHWPMIVFLQNLGIVSSTMQHMFLFPAMILVSMVIYKEVEVRFLRINIPTVSKRSAARRTRYFPLNTDALKYSSIFIFTFIVIVNVQFGSDKPFVTELFKAKVVEPWTIPAEITTPLDPKRKTNSPVPNIEVINIYDQWKQKIAEGLQVDSLPTGIQPSLNALDADRLSRWNLCLTIIENNSKCNSGPENAPRKVYILGDSYALSAAPMIFNAFSDPQYQVIARNRGQCMVPDVPTINKGIIDIECSKHREKVNQEILSERPYFIIAISLNSNKIKGNLEQLKEASVREYQFLVENAGKVLVIGETPFTADPRSCIKSDKNIQGCVGNGKSRQEYRSITESAARKAGAEYLDLTPWMCLGFKCPLVIENSFVTWDGGHLTSKFSSKLSPLFMETLSRIGIL